MAEQQKTNQFTKRQSRGDIFILIGIGSILIGFVTFFIPWLWGIPLIIAGLIMGRKEKGKKLPFLTRISEMSPLDNIGKY